MSEDRYVVDHPAHDTLTADVVDTDDLPRVSFCIPTLDDEQTLDACLASIAAQDYPDVELVIVDGGSTDRTVDIAREYTEDVYFDDGLLGSARQTGFERSTGTLVGLFDADVYLPHESWLRTAVEYFNFSDHVSTVWPMVSAPPGGSPVTKLYNDHTSLVIQNRIEHGRGLYGGGNSLFRRDCLDAIGGINPELHWGEDLDWAQKLRDRGYQVVYVRDPVYHDTMRTLGQFGRKQLTSADAFAGTSISFMDLSKRELFREQVVLGAKGMYDGLIHDGDYFWSLFPLMVALRIAAYAYTFGKNAVASVR